ncbi:MAG: class I SAM-dependent methyltransferase [Pyrinomonadaceae bacterium]
MIEASALQAHQQNMSAPTLANVLNNTVVDTFSSDGGLLKQRPVATTLPREMEQHAYPAMYRLEESHWWFVGRRRIISSFVEQAASSLPTGGHPPRILDVGCGTGANLLMLNQHGEAHGVDISPDALSFCQSRGLNNVQYGEAESLPYEDNSFDIVTSIDVIEHLDDDVACLQEMKRILRPGGKAVLFVPAFMFLWSDKDEVVRHRRRYRLPQMQKAVEEAGFQIKHSTYANLSFFAPILLGRALMRVLGLKANEEEMTISWLNRMMGRLFGAERHWLRRGRFPFGVSVLCVAQKPA